MRPFALGVRGESKAAGALAAGAMLLLGAACGREVEPPRTDAVLPGAPGLAAVETMPCQAVGDATFCAERRTFRVGADGTALLAADLDRDGRAELAVASATWRRVEVLFDVGGTPSFEFIELDGTPRALAAQDLDGDGRVDLAVTYFAWSDLTWKLAVAFGSELGFDAPREASLSGPGLALAAGAVAGAPALAVGGPGRVELWTAPGRELERRASLDVDGTVSSLAFESLGSAPMLGVSPEAELVFVETSDEDAGLLRAARLEPGADLRAVQARDLSDNPNALAFGRFSRGGQRKLAILSDREAGRVETVNVSSGNFTGLSGGPTFRYPHALAVVDLDVDEVDDLLVVSGGAADVAVLRGAGGALDEAALLPHGLLDPVAVAAGDLDGDGAVDFAALGYGGQLAVFLGRP